MKDFPHADDFKGWLEGHPDDKRWYCAGETCALAQFLTAWYDEPVSITSDAGHNIVLFTVLDGRSLPQPIWATRFVQKFDDSKLVYSPKNVLRILAGARSGLKRS